MSYTQRGSDIDGNSIDDYLGYSVALNNSGNRLITGAILKGTSGTEYVRVYDYDTSLSSWVQIGSDLTSISSNNDNFGYSVAISSNGNVIAVGAPNGKYVKIYSWNGSSWGSTKTITSSSDDFGHDIALNDDGDILAISSIGTANGSV